MADVARHKGEKEIMNWQPIETAPQDASVLIYIPNAEHYGEGIYRAILSSEFGGWTTFGLHVGRAVGSIYQPTHWMPLPEAPGMKRQDARDLVLQRLAALPEDRRAEGIELLLEVVEGQEKAAA